MSVPVPTARDYLTPMRDEPGSRPSPLPVDSTADQNTLHDVIIIGLGAMGSAALYHCARRGLKVLGIERFPHVAHARGSSHGESRIIRKAYWEHPAYVPLLQESYALWHELEAETKAKLLHYTGGLDIGQRDDAGVVGAIRACTEHSLPHEVLSAAETAERFPGLTLPEGYVAVYQRDAGILAPERCIEAHYVLAQTHGARARLGCEVTDVTLAAGGEEVAVSTTQGTFRAKKVVFSAGPWTTQAMTKASVFANATFAATAKTALQFTTANLTPANENKCEDKSEAPKTEPTPETAKTEAEAETTEKSGVAPVPTAVTLPRALRTAIESLVVERQVVTWYKPRPEYLDKYDHTRFPIFIAHLDPSIAPAPPGVTDGGQGGYYYGFPVFGPDNAFKLARYNHLLEAVADPLEVQRSVSKADIDTQTVLINTLFPGLTCDTNSAETNNKSSGADSKTTISTGAVNAVDNSAFSALEKLAAMTLASGNVSAEDAEAESIAAAKAADKADKHGTYGAVAGCPANHVKSVTCMFTNTPDSHFIIDSFPLVPIKSKIKTARNDETVSAAAAASAVAPIAPPLASTLASQSSAADSQTATPLTAEEAELAAGAAAQLEAAPRAVFVSACAGHGFKFASAIGAAIADLVEVKPRPDLAWLGLGRFENGVPPPMPM